MLVTLKCGHTKNIDQTKKNKYALCKRCGTTVEVVTNGYKVACRACRYVRWFGDTNFAARVYAVRHKLTRRHTVDLIAPDGTVEEVFQWDQVELPLDGSAPF